MERTLILIKPDGVSKGLAGEVISRFERAGLKIVGLKIMQADNKIGKKHYPVTDEWAEGIWSKTKAGYEREGKEFNYSVEEIAEMVQGRLIKFLTSSPIVAMVLDGLHAVAVCRKICGATEPYAAAPGTIRGDFSIDAYDLAMAEERSIENIVHASGSIEEAEREISIWFSEEELIK